MFLCLFFCIVCNVFFKLILYITLLLPSRMNESNFWTSEQRLLTSNWTSIFSLTSPTPRMSCFLRNVSESLSFARRKDREKGGGGRTAFWEFVGEWVNLHYHPFYWPTWNHLKTKWVIYDQDCPTNGTIKTVISCVSPSRGWTTTWITYSWQLIPYTLSAG